jgi:NDP-sugar pyrophosphorylase family protein
MTQPNIVILVGGRGERMGVLTENTAKCMLLVTGKPILHHILEQIDTHVGKCRVILTTSGYHTQISDHFGESFGNLDLCYLQDRRPLETRRRIESVQHLIDGPFVVLGSDVLFGGHQLLKMIESFRSVKNNTVLGVVGAADTHGPTNGHALVQISNNTVVEYLHHPPMHWMGENWFRDMHMYHFDERIFEISKAAPAEIFWVERVVMWAREQGYIFLGQPYSGNWYHFADEHDLTVSIQL